MPPKAKKSRRSAARPRQTKSQAKTGDSVPEVRENSCASSNDEAERVANPEVASAGAQANSHNSEQPADNSEQPGAGRVSVDKQTNQDVVAESPAEPLLQASLHTTKGKQTAPAADTVPPDEEGEGVDGNDEGEGEDAGDGAEEDWVKSTGPLPNTARIEAQQLATVVAQQAEELARKYKKSVRDILLAAGLSVRAARARSPYNMFIKWYAHFFPRDKTKVSWQEYGAIMTKAYNKQVKDVKDPQKRAEAMQPIWDYVDSLDATATSNQSCKSVVATMQSAKEQFTTLAASYHNLEQIEVVGAIVYTGVDPGARQTSTIFGGSSLIREVLADNKADVRTMLDDLTTMLKSADLKKRGFKLSSVYVNVERRQSEAPRDHYRRVFTVMMTSSLEKYDDVPSMKKMHWKLWLKTARIHQLRIVNWPAGVRTPGPDFDLKNLDMVDLGALVEGFIEHKRGGGTSAMLPKIVRWSNEEKSYATHDKQQGEILVVISVQGVPLRLLRDCKDWVGLHLKARKTYHRRLRASGLSVSDTESDSDEAESEDSLQPTRKKKASGHPTQPTQPTSKSGYHRLLKEEARLLAALRSTAPPVVAKEKSSVSQHGIGKKRVREYITSDDEDIRHREKVARHIQTKGGYEDKDSAPKERAGGRAQLEALRKAKDYRRVEAEGRRIEKGMVLPRSHGPSKQSAGPSRLAHMYNKAAGRSGDDDSSTSGTDSEDSSD